MFQKILSVALAVFAWGYCPAASGQHFNDHGGHYDYHNGHIDYHQPGHLDVHGGHLDYHPGHVDHLYPSHHAGTHYYYPSSPSFYGSTVYPSSPIYSSGTIISSGQSVISGTAPSNALPKIRVVAGYAPNQAPINIINPETYKTALSFKLNGQTVRLEPGSQKSLIFDRNYIIEFDRGGTFGTARYSLRDGDFRFVVGSQGWDLQKVQVDANPIPATESYGAEVQYGQ